MNCRILNSSYVLDFENVGFNNEQIEDIVKQETNKMLLSFKMPELMGWNLYFRFRYNNCKKILIYRKTKSIASEKIKEIIVHIPIPTKDKVKWGVNLEQHIYKDENHLDHLMKNFTVLDVDFVNFNSRTDYIIDSMRRAIKFCLEDGVTINGIKIKTA